MKAKPLILSVALLLSISFFSACDDSQEETIVETFEADTSLSKFQDYENDACGLSFTTTDMINLSEVYNDSSDLSYSLLKTSQDFLKLSDSIAQAGSLMNDEYIQSTLALSQDILKMADSIGYMGDRILLTSDNIGEMADRITQTELTQSENILLIQENLLKTQTNLSEPTTVETIQETTPQTPEEIIETVQEVIPQTPEEMVDSIEQPLVDLPDVTPGFILNTDFGN